MRYEEIIFDIDGTLIDTDYAILHSLQDTLKALTGNILPTDDLAFALGITGEHTLKRLQIRDIASALELWDKNMAGYSTTVKVFEKIPELLDTLSQSGYKMGIVTSKTRLELEHDFESFGLSGHFRTIVCADDTKEHKPHSAPLLKYMERSGGSRHKMIYVGDSAYDSQCAKGAGIDFALAGWGKQTVAIQANYILETPLDLVSILCSPV